MLFLVQLSFVASFLSLFVFAAFSSVSFLSATKILTGFNEEYVTSKPIYFQPVVQSPSLRTSVGDPVISL